MSLDDRLSDLIKQIYTSGSDSRAWDQVGDQVVNATQARLGLTTLVDLGKQSFETFRFYGACDSQFARGVEEYQHLEVADPTLAWAGRHPDGRFCESARTIPAADYLGNDYVRWNHARFGATHWVVGFTPLEDQLAYSFSVHFPAEQGPGASDALGKFRLLFDHLANAIQLSHRPFDTECTRSLLLLDRLGMVRAMSRGAEQALTLDDGLTISAMRLVAARSEDQSRLDRALANSASAASSGACKSALLVGRPSGKRPWIVTIRPMLNAVGPFGRFNCELIVQVFDGAPPIGDLGSMRPMYDLTCRELDILRLLADGHSVESLATSSGISVNTARTHLRAIFAKTSTSRQSELLTLCCSLAGV